MSAVIPDHAQRRNSREPPPAEDSARTGSDARGPRTFLRRSRRRLATTEVLDEHLLVPAIAAARGSAGIEGQTNRYLLVDTQARTDLL